MFSMCMCGGDWGSEKLSRQVKLGGSSPKWQVL